MEKHGYVEPKVKVYRILDDVITTSPQEIPFDLGDWGDDIRNDGVGGNGVGGNGV